MQIIQFPTGGQHDRKEAVTYHDGETQYGRQRLRSAVRKDIEEHERARIAYAKAVAWQIAMQDEEASPDKLEAARQQVESAFAEMKSTARHLLICTPTDPVGLIDLLMYLEKNFTALPADVWSAGGSQSLAFNLLRTVRLSLRAVVKHGNVGPR